MTKEQQTKQEIQNAARDTILFPDEIAHLEAINQQLDQALADADADVERMDQEYMDAKRYMVAYRGEIDPHEMFQNELGLRQIDNLGVLTVTLRDKIAKLKDSPYFARIDFCLHGDDTAEVFYIGRFAFHHEHELLVSDWRAPVASMFYDCEIGPAGYMAPVGKVEGKLTRKRQFKIKHGHMEYAIESSLNIQDDVLQQELSHTSDEKMKSIIATIQKEQNQIIRNEHAHTLLIQGVAGSGKTSIALHRIAFLLYRFKDRLSAKHVTILSPNQVFGDYIANVLPELGEEPIYEISFADIANVQLEHVMKFEAARDPLETLDAAWSKRVQFKSTLAFVKLMNAFIEQIPDLVFAPVDYSFGRFTATADFIHSRFRAYGNYPVKRRLQMIADDLLDRFTTDNIMEEEVPKNKTILKALKQMLTVKDTLVLYKMFYKANDIANLFVIPAKKTLEWNDVYPFLYLHAAFEGLQESSIIKHLVIDEMQDYTPIQYAVINLLFKCPKTILGDFDQFIHPHHLHTLKDIRQLYQDAEFVALTKSYRSTYEIISFARQLKGTEAIEAMERHGELPTIVKCVDDQAELDSIKNQIETFSQGKDASLGILVKTNQDAKHLYDLLSAAYPLHLITPDSTQFTNGVSITSIQMSKGLEFDEVLLPFVNCNMYSNEYDRSLLYIGCTRAMHRLTLLYTGECAPFVRPLLKETICIHIK